MKIVYVYSHTSHTHEEIVCVWGIAANAEQFHQVVELAMDITAYLFTTIYEYLHSSRLLGVTET